LDFMLFLNFYMFQLVKDTYFLLLNQPNNNNLIFKNYLYK